MPAKFNNPYHFIPCEARSAQQKHNDILTDDWLPRDSRVNHERYHPETYSGRVVVRLKTVTPVAVGAQQKKKKGVEGVVSPYLVEGKAAIPGSTLRGMVGSLMEAATNGPLRVLEDRHYSFRMAMNEYLSAIGIVVREKGKLAIKPCCLPTLTSSDGGRTFDVPGQWKKVFPLPQFKVHFGTGAEIRSESFQARTSLTDQHISPYQVKQLLWAGEKVSADRSLKVKAGKYLVSQHADGQVPEARPGYIRVLGCWGARAKDIPKEKTHELWIPVPHKDAKALPIPDAVLKRFEQLADERTEEDCTDEDLLLPYHLKDTKRNPDPAEHGKKLRIKPHDLVFFDLNAKGEVTVVSFSSIWRKRVEDRNTGEPHTAHSFFSSFANRDGEHLPFSDQRKTISLVEQILGFTEDRPPAEKGDEEALGEERNPGLAYASRIRFADALLHESTDAGKVLEQEQVLLKILSSPKPPCPNLYFRKRGASGHSLKSHLSVATHLPQGRKHYLHAKVEEGTQPWKTRKKPEKPDQNNCVQPIRAGQSFYFHIDFDNLSRLELGLLLFSLAPTASFHHKVGMGKPLGLGSVKLTAVAVLLVNRGQRYTAEGLFAPRYEFAHMASEGQLDELPARYGEEARTTAAAASEYGSWHREFAESGILPEAVKKALELLGDPARAPRAADLRYPTTARQPDKESKHYEWFVFNDGQRERGAGMSPASQFLAPITSSTNALPTLEEMELDAPSASWQRR
jgi:CRISPR-associated protein (TIGR03986 family)